MTDYKCTSHHGSPESYQKTDIEKYKANTLTFDLQQQSRERPSNPLHHLKSFHLDVSSQPSAMIPMP
jgi:hypothetical protein